MKNRLFNCYSIAFLTLIIFLCTAGILKAQILDENLVLNYMLPPWLTLNNGKKVTSKSTWENSWRSEIIALLKKEVYCVMPEKPKRMQFDVFNIDFNEWKSH